MIMTQSLSSQKLLGNKTNQAKPNQKLSDFQTLITNKLIEDKNGIVILYIRGFL